MTDLNTTVIQLVPFPVKAKNNTTNITLLNMLIISRKLGMESITYYIARVGPIFLTYF